MKKFKGIFTALVTPFLKGEIDFFSLERLIEDQIKKAVDGFVVSGTTGESPTLSHEEKKKIFNFIKERIPQNFPLILGAGNNSTAMSIEEACWAQKLGADAILSVVPYYNKPPQRGLIEHFKQIASSIEIPCILYNVPSRTVVSLELETILRLSEQPNIIGIKEASGNIKFAEQIRKNCGENFILLSGDDGSYDDFMAIGGNGVISVASHIIPESFKLRKVSEYKTFVDQLFVEANPIPIKMALFLRGIIKSPECRLPLMTLTEEYTENLKKEMSKRGLI